MFEAGFEQALLCYYCKRSFELSTATKSGILDGLEICGQGKRAKMHVDIIYKGNLTREIDPKMMGRRRGKPGGAKVAQN